MAQLPNKFYKVVTNGIPSYQVIPFKNAADEENLIKQGFTPITQQEYIAGQQGEIARLNSLGYSSRPDVVQAINTIKSDISKYSSLPATSTEAGPSGYITDPTGAFRTQESYDALQANKAAVQAGTMTEVQPGMYVPKGSAAELNITKPEEYQSKYGGGTFDEKGTMMIPPTPTTTIAAPQAPQEGFGTAATPMQQAQAPQQQTGSLSLGTGKEVAPFGMEGLPRGAGQGGYTPPTETKTAPVQASIMGGNQQGSLQGTMSSSIPEAQGTMKAPPEPQFKQPQGQTRAFAGLTPQQVSELDTAYLRGMVGEKDKANIDYATRRFGYTPPSAQIQEAPFVPPNQDSGMARNLKAEQDFVKNWQGKGGRLPTANEINMAVYGTTNPMFNVVTSQMATGGQTQTYTAPRETMVGAQQPPANYLDTLQGSVSELGGMSAEEIAARKQLEDLMTSRAMGLNVVEDQPIAMPFITGQSASIERRAMQQADTLERKLARLQAEREAKRQAAFDLASIEGEKAKMSADKERLAMAARDAEQERLFGLLEKGYTPLTGPSAMQGLSEQDIMRIPGTDTILRRPVETRSSEMDKLLTPAEAARLGVPYGTTRGQAAQGSITPSFGRASSGGGSRTSSSPGTITASVGQLSEKSIDSIIKGYPQDFRAYIKSIAPKVSYKLTPQTVGSLYAQFTEQKSKGILPHGAQAKAAVIPRVEKTTTVSSSGGDQIDALISQYLK